MYKLRQIMQDKWHLVKDTVLENEGAFLEEWRSCFQLHIARKQGKLSLSFVV